MQGISLLYAVKEEGLRLIKSYQFITAWCHSSLVAIVCSKRVNICAKILPVQLQSPPPAYSRRMEPIPWSGRRQAFWWRRPSLMSWEHIAAVDLSEKFIIEKLVRCIFCSHGLSHGLMNFLNVHKRIFSGKRPQRCTQYNYSASQLVSPRNYISKHTGEKTHHCNQCEY